MICRIYLRLAALVVAGCILLCIDALTTSFTSVHHHTHHITTCRRRTSTHAFIGNSHNIHNQHRLHMTNSEYTQTAAATESSSWSKLTVPQLKSILKENNLPLSGVKAELISRLENHHATGAAAEISSRQSSSNDIEENNDNNNNNLQSSSKMNQSDSTNNGSTSTTKFPPPKDKTEIQVVEKEVHETVRLLDSLKLGGNKSNGSSNGLSSSSVSNTQEVSSGRSAQASKSRQLTRDQEKELMNSLKQSLKSSQQQKKKEKKAQSTSKSTVSSAHIISGEDTNNQSHEDLLQGYIEQIRPRSANDIKAELQSLKLPVKGRKPDLVTRLAGYYMLNGGENGVEDDDRVNDGLVGIEMPKEKTSLKGRNTMSSFAGITNLSKNAADALQYAFGNNNDNNNEKEASLTVSIDPEPTPIQSVAISKLFYPPNPSAILHAPTGSGKTITYLLPITETLWKEVESSNNGDNVDPNDMANGMALILLPTRELASQVAGVATVLAPPGMVRLIPQPTNLMNCWKKENDRGEEYEYLERVGNNDEIEEDEGKGTRRYKPRILVGSAKSISISLFGDKKMPGTPTNKPQGKQLLSSVRWLVMDEVDRLLDIKKSRTDTKSRHEKPAALLSAAIARLTLGRVQVIAASATVGRPLRRELSRVLGLHSSECPETLRGEVDTNNMNERINDNDTIHVGRAVKIPDTVRNYVLPVDGSTSGSLLTSAAFASKSILQSSTSFDNVVGRKVLLVLTRNCDIKVHNALGALRHFGIKPEPQSLLDALGADGTDRLVEAHRRVSGVVGVGGSANKKRQRGKSGIVNNGEENDDGYLLVTHEDNVRGLHLDGLDAVIVVGRPGSPDEYTHIAGRTGRAGKRGSVLNIVSFEQAAALASWTKMLGVDFLPVDESDVGSVINDEY